MIYKVWSLLFLGCLVKGLPVSNLSTDSDGEKIKIYFEASVPNGMKEGSVKLEYHYIRHHGVESYRDCNDVPNGKDSGIYTINLDGIPKEVYCEIYPDGTKYMVIQRRLNGQVDFYRNWTEYENGFGYLSGEFWLGNYALYQLSSRAEYKLRVELQAFDLSRAYAEYNQFSVGSPASKYLLNINGYSGNAGDSLSAHNGQQFTTFDQHNDESDTNCAITYKGAWWYKKCHASNLNGFYYHGNHTSYADGVNWHAFKGHHDSMKTVVMKISRNN